MITTESLFDSSDEIRLCRGSYAFGMQHNYFIANHSTNKVLRDISSSKFQELLDNFIFTYLGEKNDVESWVPVKN